MKRTKMYNFVQNTMQILIFCVIVMRLANQQSSDGALTPALLRAITRNLYSVSGCYSNGALRRSFEIPHFGGVVSVGCMFLASCMTRMHRICLLYTSDAADE